MCRHGKGFITLSSEGGVARRCISVHPLECPAHLSNTLPLLLLLHQVGISVLATPTSHGYGCTHICSTCYLWYALRLPASGHGATPIPIRIRVRFPIPVLGHDLVHGGWNQALVKRAPVVGMAWPCPSSGIAPPTCCPLWDTPPWGGVEGHIGHVLPPHRWALPVAPYWPPVR